MTLEKVIVCARFLSAERKHWRGARGSYLR